MISVKDQLLEFQSLEVGAKERCGFVLTGDRIVELDNVAEDPVADFMTRPEDVLEVIDDAIATWHTHPGISAELSVADYHSFIGFPGFTHYIVGADGVNEYYEKDGAILNA